LRRAGGQIRDHLPAESLAHRLAEQVHLLLAYDQHVERPSFQASRRLHRFLPGSRLRGT
jgi:hypothetical protein